MQLCCRKDVEKKTDRMTFVPFTDRWKINNLREIKLSSTCRNLSLNSHLCIMQYVFVFLFLKRAVSLSPLPTVIEKVQMQHNSLNSQMQIKKLQQQLINAEFHWILFIFWFKFHLGYYRSHCIVCSTIWHTTANLLCWHIHFCKRG